MAATKTPVTVLQELSMKKRGEAPNYDYIGEDCIGENSKIFTYKVKAFGLEATGQGRNKKDAKHNSAAELLKQLAKQITDPDFTVPNTEAKQIQNAVGDLLDLCVVRDYPIAQFTTIQASGPSHAPEFTYECRISTIVKTATSSTKKGAKQLAAAKMLETILEMPQSVEKMQLCKLDEALVNEDEDQDRIDTYLKYKLADIKKTPVKLRDRHLFFTKLDEEKRERAKCVFKSTITDETKLDTMLNILDLKYEIKDCPYLESNKQFELIKCDYDCFFASENNIFYTELLKYLQTMLAF